MHFRTPDSCWLLVASLGLLVLGVGVTSWPALRALASGARGTEPTLHLFLLTTLAVAWVAGVVMGVLNFSSYMERYYAVTGLGMYPGIDPASTSGSRMLDAGRVVFTSSSHLDIGHSIGFKNGQIYCVAPIASTAEPLVSYDFWAVGVDCCSSGKSDFHCGEFNNKLAHSGLRLMDDGQQAYFQLAVDQAEATHGIKANHPLFFSWVEDPLEETGNLQARGWSFFKAGSLAFVAVQFCLVALVFLCSVGLGKRQEHAESFENA